MNLNVWHMDASTGADVTLIPKIRLQLETSSSMLNHAGARRPRLLPTNIKVPWRCGRTSQKKLPSWDLLLQYLSGKEKEKLPIHTTCIWRLKAGINFCFTNYHNHWQMLTSIQGQNHSLGIREFSTIRNCWGLWISVFNENRMSQILHTFSYDRLSRCEAGIHVHVGVDYKDATGKNEQDILQLLIDICTTTGIWGMYQFCNRCLVIPKPLCICCSHCAPWKPGAPNCDCAWCHGGPKGMHVLWCIHEIILNKDIVTHQLESCLGICGRGLWLQYWA